MKLIRLTKENANKYIGYQILFKTKGSYIVKKILGVNKSSIKIDHPYLHNQLEMLTREIYVIS